MVYKVKKMKRGGTGCNIFLNKTVKTEKLNGSSKYGLRYQAQAAG